MYEFIIVCPSLPETEKVTLCQYSLTELFAHCFVRNKIHLSSLCLTRPKCSLRMNYSTFHTVSWVYTPLAMRCGVKHVCAATRTDDFPPLAVVRTWEGLMARLQTDDGILTRCHKVYMFCRLMSETLHHCALPPLAAPRGSLSARA